MLAALSPWELSQRRGLGTTTEKSSGLNTCSVASYFDGMNSCSPRGVLVWPTSSDPEMIWSACSGNQTSVPCPQVTHEVSIP
ncbi:unnamed protein product [Protopolystoma xenopodis]|uniref:Uncharacterized protein n=1 Tax=Protopolystoma xenopodis TaxID=117903 RepID=A0A3S5CSG8_9PLAT|nr:unnamed protein product [Protopolystoma xenopodis]